MKVQIKNPTLEIDLHGGEVWVSLAPPPAGVPALNGVRAQNHAQGLGVPQVFSGPHNPGDDFYIEDYWGEVAVLIGWWFDPITGEANQQLSSPPFTLEKDATFSWDMATNTVVKQLGSAWPWVIGATVVGVIAVAVLRKK